MKLALTKECDHYAYSYKTKEHEFFELRKCPLCKGRGEVPSEAGQELLDFLREHFK